MSETAHKKISPENFEAAFCNLPEVCVDSLSPIGRLGQLLMLDKISKAALGEEKENCGDRRLVWSLFCGPVQLQW